MVKNSNVVKSKLISNKALLYAGAALLAIHATSASGGGGGIRRPLSNEDFTIFSVLAITLICFAGVFSGLTVGLLSLDPIELKIRLLKCTCPKERENIKKIFLIISNHHLLIVTLLMGNTLCMEGLPMVLDKLLGPVWAMIISCTAVLILGEILPQAFCTGKHQIRIASSLIPIVRFFMMLFAFLAVPFANILDSWLGHGDENHDEREHLKMLIRLHGISNEVMEKDGATESHEKTEQPQPLMRDEVCVLEGALDLARKKVSQIMVPFDEVFALDINAYLTKDLLEQIVIKGHSRIPVYEDNRNNIRGLILVKQLILLDPNEGAPVRKYIMSNPLVAHPEASLYDILNEFQVGRSHISLVTEDVIEYTSALEERRSVAPGAKVIGIVTLEDIIEELIQEEILDEFDGSTNVHMLQDSGAGKKAATSNASVKNRGKTPNRRQTQSDLAKEDESPQNQNNKKFYSRQAVQSRHRLKSVNSSGIIPSDITGDAYLNDPLEAPLLNP